MKKTILAVAAALAMASSMAAASAAVAYAVPSCKCTKYGCTCDR